MRALVIDEAALERGRAVRKYAIEHRENLASIMARMNKPEIAPGNDPNFVLELFDGWRVVMTVEQQPPPIGWCYHLSFSIVPKDLEKPFPHPVAVEQILPILGINAKLEDKLHSARTGHIIELWFRYDGEP